MYISKKKNHFVLIAIVVFQLCSVNTVQARRIGDINGDNTINISDLVFLINLILSPPLTKLDNIGNSLPSVATEWSCVKDNETHLIWEVKTNDKGLRDQNWRYSWFNSTGINDGGDPGSSNGGTCFDSTHCDTEKFVQQVNSQGLCGHNDWRMPTRYELGRIVTYSYEDPAIDEYYFPKTIPFEFWSASPDGFQSNAAWFVDFDYGDSDYNVKSRSSFVRLVREEQ